MHPVLAAKQAATIDHISNGRLTLDVVGGWNRPELEMFGAPLREHGQRYEHLAEWLQVVKMLWQSPDEFDHHGEFFDIIGGISLPKPDRKRTRLNSSNQCACRMPSSARKKTKTTHNHNNPSSPLTHPTLKPNTYDYPP